MKNQFEIWLKTNTPSGQVWAARLLSLAAAVGAPALVALSFILMAELGHRARESAMHARAPAATAPPAQTVRYAAALPMVTVVGRREPGKVALGTPTATVPEPARVASEDAAVSIEIAGDHLRR